MGNTKRFDRKGEIYAKARPGYPSELLNYLKNTLQFGECSTFADIGSGTGIFSELLLNCVYHVYAVEPNADMRMKAEEKFDLCGCEENPYSINGSTYGCNAVRIM